VTDLAGSGAIVQHELAEVSRAIVLSNLTALVRGLETVKSDLQEIQVTTKNLQDSSNNLARSTYDEGKLILANLSACHQGLLT
jgi:prominin 1